MTGWSDFAVVIGGAAAALTGLLFVAVTLRIDVVGPSVALRSRAAQTLVIFTVVIVIAALLSAPQRTLTYAIESLALGIAEAVMLAVLDRRAKRSDHAPGRFERYVRVVSPNTAAPALLIIGAILLLAHIEWAIALQVAALLLGIAGGIAGAWAFIVRLGPDSHP